MRDFFAQFLQLRMIDLTHPLCSDIPSWNGSSAFRLSDKDQISMLTSSGTHIDTPALFFEEGMTIDQIPLHQLVGPACVIDVSKKAEADYQISSSDIDRYEAEYGIIPPLSIVVGFTGWSRHWTSPKAYRNADGKGHTHFPTFELSAIEELMKRKISGVAIDTLALESLDSSFRAHKLLLGSGKYIIENIANAWELPPKGSYILALPLKIQNGLEAPSRVIGLM